VLSNYSPLSVSVAQHRAESSAFCSVLIKTAPRPVEQAQRQAAAQHRAEASAFCSVLNKIAPLSVRVAQHRGKRLSPSRCRLKAPLFSFVRVAQHRRRHPPSRCSAIIRPSPGESRSTEQGHQPSALRSSRQQSLAPYEQAQHRAEASAFGSVLNKIAPLWENGAAPRRATVALSVST
jgi:hypothetical protein